MGINFGGFVPVSTVDWRGRSTCVIFFRGCPARCWYCHNPHLRKGDYDIKSTDDILDMIESSKLLISGVVFSGGEPTMQSSIVELAQEVKKLDYPLAIHTSGINPDILEELILKNLVTKISLDIKTSWGRNFENYNKFMRGYFGYHVRRSLKICEKAFFGGVLPEFEVVTTLFPPNHVIDVLKIEKYLDKNTKWVLNQGVINSKAVLTCEDIMVVVGLLERSVYIRTKNDGEFEYGKT